MKTKLFFTLIILFICSITFAQSDDEFTYATAGVDGSEYYIYIEKVNYTSKEVWVKSIKPTKSVKNKKGKYIQTGGGHTLAFMIVNCDDRKYDIKQRITYDKSGNVTSNDDFPSFDNKVIPGSVMSGIFNAICSN